MSFSINWNLEKYKSEHESDEHWQLRKRFMEVHKNEFPEDKLVCLAQVFCNIEFLGCRYPEKTMKLVAELSKGVADDYREKKKGMLKRTFVQASDAAGAKAKGRGATPPTRITEGPPSKQAKMDSETPKSGFKYSCFVHESVVKPPKEGEFPGFIIYESCKTSCPINILTQSSQKNRTWNSISFDFPLEKNSPEEKYCEIFLNKKLLASSTGPNVKAAKSKAALEGLNKLRQTCYTIQEKLSFVTDGEIVSKDQVVKGSSTTPISQDNIGSRMMMKMGWTGTGLGKNQQGIQTPIEASQTMKRTGLGHLSTSQFHNKFRNVFREYIASSSTNDLVFAPDFSAEERKILHRLAQNMNLKTKSHGKNEQRQLVVYKILSLDQILETLLQCGGENEKYSLRYPDPEASSYSEVSNDCIVEKETHNVSANTNPTDSPKEKETSVTSKSQLEKTSQHQDDSGEKSSDLKTDSLNEGISSESVPKILCLRSDDAVGIRDTPDNNVKRANVVSNLIETAENDCDVEESDIEVINRVIENKKEEITALQTKFEKLLEIFKKDKKFSKHQSKKYFRMRMRLQNITGTFILNVLKPEYTIEDWKRGNVPEHECLTNFKVRAEAVGLAEIESNVGLKKEVIRTVKNTLKIKKLIKYKTITRNIRVECRKIGSKLVSNALYNIKYNKPKKVKTSEVRRFSIPKVKNVPKVKNKRKFKSKLKRNRSRKHYKAGSKNSKSIIFIKEGEMNVEDSSSGMEYSDMEQDE